MDFKIGVIPFDVSGDRIAVMFVTSQKRGRWILPKGNLKSGETHKQGVNERRSKKLALRNNNITSFNVFLINNVLLQ